MNEMTLREELAVLLQDYWDVGVEHGHEGQDPDAVSPMKVTTKQEIWATVDKIVGSACRSLPATAREVVIEQELIDLEQGIVECRTLTDFVTVQKTVLATRSAQPWEI